MTLLKVLATAHGVVLQLNRDSTATQIVSAYRKLSRHVHAAAPNVKKVCSRRELVEMPLITFNAAAKRQTLFLNGLGLVVLWQGLTEHLSSIREPIVDIGS